MFRLDCQCLSDDGLCSYNSSLHQLSLVITKLYSSRHCSLMAPVGFLVNQCLCGRCCWTIVEPDINNNKPSAWMFSPFRHCWAIIISQKRNFRPRLALWIRGCKHFSCLSLLSATKTLKPMLHIKHVMNIMRREANFWSASCQRSDWNCEYSVVTLMCVYSLLLSFDPESRKLCLYPFDLHVKCWFRKNENVKNADRSSKALQEFQLFSIVVFFFFF